MAFGCLVKTQVTGNRDQTHGSKHSKKKKNPEKKNKKTKQKIQAKVPWGLGLGTRSWGENKETGQTQKVEKK